MKLYSNGYIDYKTGKIISNEILFDKLDEVKYELNWKILELINDTHGIHLENKVLYILDIDSYSSCEKTIKIDYKKSLTIIKKDNTLDIYLNTVNNGYLYNNKNITHIYKFFINTHVLNIKNNESSLYNKDKKSITNDNKKIVNNLVKNDIFPKLLIELSEKIKHRNKDF